MSSRVPKVEVTADLERRLSLGHPWIYRDHVPRGFEAPAGAWVRVQAGAFSGYALWDPRSKLALRLFSREGVPDAAWVGDRVREAFRLRAPLRDDRTTAYRWIAGEGDGLPGITVDRYGPYAVLVTDADCLEPVVPWVVDALGQADELRGIVRRRRGERGGGRVEALRGRLPPPDLIIEERGLRLRANLLEGQKTGLFLDHRENRRHVEGLAAGRSVLNLFSYSGAFSLCALRGGALHVVGVDSAPNAAAAARENVTLNGLQSEAHEAIVADVFDYLRGARQRGELHDLLICDPPSFARRKEAVPRALKAYVRLHELALRVAADEAIFCAASCTARVAPEAFVDTLAEAASRTGRRLQILHEAGHAPDHPVAAGHREGRYLKFVVTRVSRLV